MVPRRALWVLFCLVSVWSVFDAVAASTSTTAALPAPSIDKVELTGDRQTQIKITWTGSGTSHRVTVTEVTPGTFTKTELLTASPATVSGLSAGRKYNVIVTAVSGSQSEDSAPELIVTAPVAPTNVHSDPASVAEKQLVIKWTFTGPVDAFEVCIDGTCYSETVPPSGNTGTHNSVNNLTPGAQHAVTVASVAKLGSDSAKSVPVPATLATKPSQPGLLSFDEGETTLKVEWTCGLTDQLDKCTVTISCEVFTPTPSSVDVPRGTCEKVFTGLTPGELCTFTVVAKTLNVTSDPRTDSAGTNTESSNYETSKGGSQIAAIVGGVLGVVILVLGVLLTFSLLRHRRSQLNASGAPTSSDNKSAVPEPTSTPDAGTTDPVPDVDHYLYVTPDDIQMEPITSRPGDATYQDLTSSGRVGRDALPNLYGRLHDEHSGPYYNMA